ncbi:MAG TPA: hypothetical protein VHE77_07200 [Dongiaceae bacterium]|jgi:hypothetical protein|nr:hypothetical protein [Dongiaceae bacterium]
MSNDLQTEVDRLVSIAQWHAWNILGRPPAEREGHLATCRATWMHYAAAFNTSAAECEDFADALDRATRDLMAEIQQNIVVVREAGGLRLRGQLSQQKPGKPQALTLAELRPIFRQIIEG